MVVIDLGPSPRTFTLIAVLDTYLLSTAFVSEAEFGELVDYRGRTLAFLRAAEGTEPDDLAAAVEDDGAQPSGSPPTPSRSCAPTWSRSTAPSPTCSR